MRELSEHQLGALSAVASSARRGEWHTPMPSLVTLRSLVRQGLIELMTEGSYSALTDAGRAVLERASRGTSHA